jgi:hypothetical protein
LRWREQGARVALQTEYPFADSVTFTVTRLASAKPLSIAFRVPGWCEGARLEVNGKPVAPQYAHGYAVVRRTWLAGDTVHLTLPMRVRMEATPDDPTAVALLHGPLVLAADLGPADGLGVATNYAGSNAVSTSTAAANTAAAEGCTPEFPPALVGADALAAIQPLTGAGGSFTSGPATRPDNLELKPFFAQYTRRSAVYFRKLSEDEWQAAHAAYLAEQGRVRELRGRAVDVVYPGDAQSEQSHSFREEKSEALHYRGRNARQARKSTWFEFRMKVADGPMVLQTTYWGDESNSHFRLIIDGTAIGTERLPAHLPSFFDRNYPIPEELTRGKSSVVVRFEPEPDANAGPVYECRMLPRALSNPPGGPVST